MDISLAEVKTGYAAIKRKAFSEYKSGNYEKSLFYINNAVTIASQIMWRYADYEIEDLLIDISKKVIPQIGNTYNADNEKVVFYDSFGLTYILAIQYLKALVAQNKQILYIYEEKNHDHKKLVPIFDAIKDYPGLTIKIIQPNASKIQKLNEIYKLLIEFSPSQLFLHIDTHGCIIPVLYSLPTQITRYYINLGDHAFWLGAKGIDFSIEFRSFGANISHEKRGLSWEQILLLPYYPIIDEKVFQGFPIASKNKTIIFSGGDFYKTIDKNNLYWDLVRSILIENPTVIILFATKLTKSEAGVIIHNFIKENNFEERFINIGFRSDINEVFKHCDIYLGTCPMSGGLMSQYAAINSKPILQFYPPELCSNNETESMICFNRKFNISFTDRSAFLNEAKSLIENEDYRRKQGELLHISMITETQFNELFNKSIQLNISQVDIEKVDVQYENLTNWWLEIGNKGYYDFRSFIFLLFGFSGLFLTSKITITYLYDRFIYSKLLNYSWYFSKLKKS